jgi:hypothetical protein
MRCLPYRDRRDKPGDDGGVGREQECHPISHNANGCCSPEVNARSERIHASPEVSNMMESSASRGLLPAHTTNWKAW